MRHLAFTVVLVAALHCSLGAAGAAIVPATDLDGLDVGTQVLADRSSAFMTADLTGQGGPPSESIGTMVASVWLKDGVYTYKFVVTPTANFPRQFLSQFHVGGFDPAIHKVGWSFTDATAAGVSGEPSTGFSIVWSVHNGTKGILNFAMPAAQANAGFWNDGIAGNNLLPIAFFFQTPHAPELSVYSLSGIQIGTTTSYAPSLIAIGYDGKLRDRVGPGNTGLGADGEMDGTLTVFLSAAGGRTVTRVQLQSSAPGTWDTDGATSAWLLGVAGTLDDALANDPGTMGVSLPVADNGTFRLFAADFANIEFVPGVTLTVTVSFSDGTSTTSAVLAGATADPPTLTLSYDGKLRDRVGPGSVGLGADGEMDGTLTVTLSASGGRTITRLTLQSTAPGTWDTEGATSAWLLGVASTLDGTLLNDPGTMAVNLAVPDGGSLRLFAADFANIEFVPGTTLTVVAVFSDGTSAWAATLAAPTGPPPALTLAYDGKLRDRVAPGSLGIGADGPPDGTFTVTLAAAGGRTITRLRLQSSAPGSWDTEGATSAWLLGVASTLDGALLNDPGTMGVSFGVPDGGTFRLFAADFDNIEFVPGTVLTVIATLSDGTTLTAQTIATEVADPPSLALSYDGKLRDRVGQSNLQLGADGALDGTLTVTLSASGGRTITRLTLQSTAPGTWDTDGTTSAWALGVAPTLDGALLNDPVTMGVGITVADGGGLRLFAADWADIEFVPGTTLSVTAVFSDNTSARASITVP
jgi:hypothetical protein